MPETTLSPKISPEEVVIMEVQWQEYLHRTMQDALGHADRMYRKYQLKCFARSRADARRREQARNQVLALHAELTSQVGTEVLPTNRSAGESQIRRVKEIIRNYIQALGASEQQCMHEAASEVRGVWIPTIARIIEKTTNKRVFVEQTKTSEEILDFEEAAFMF